MNKFVKTLIVLVILPIAVIAPVFLAQTLALDARVAAQQGNLQQRVEQYKAKLQTQPSQSDLNKLKLRCSVAQERLKAVGTRAGTVQEKRVAAYGSINKTLDELTAALKAKNINTTSLETQSRDLKAKTDAFATDLSAYKQSVEDAAGSDCASDPLALRAALEDARNYHTKLVQEVADIRTYVNNVVKVTLKQTRDDLVTQQQAAASGATSPTPDTSTQPAGGATGATQ